MNTFDTEQEKFWNGEFGDEYVDRNQDANLVSSALRRFSNIFSHMDKISNCLELGTNIGINLMAIRSLIPDIKMAGVEINHKAANMCREIKGVEIYEESILNFKNDNKWDLVFTSGVLIHINPEALDRVYRVLYEQSNRYICVNEYYNPTPMEVSYRGHREKLFKRDFAGELMDRYPNLKLVNYGFCYQRDRIFPGGDSTWFLMEKEK